MGNIRATLELPVLDSKSAASVLAAAVDLMANANAIWFSQHGDAPRCAACMGARYESPPMRRNPTYYGAEAILEHPKRGWQCADLVAYDVGRLRSLGKQAVPLLIELAPFDFHVVLLSGGREYDISRDIMEGKGCPCLL